MLNIKIIISTEGLDVTPIKEIIDQFVVERERILDDVDNTCDVGLLSAKGKPARCLLEGVGKPLVSLLENHQCQDNPRLATLIENINQRIQPYKANRYITSVLFEEDTLLLNLRERKYV